MFPPLKFSITTTGRFDENFWALVAICKYSWVTGEPPSPSLVKQRAHMRVDRVILIELVYSLEELSGTVPLVE